MVRVPDSYLRAGFAGLSGGTAMARPDYRRIRSRDIREYNKVVTVDLGNDGVAPNAIFTAGGTAQATVGPLVFGELWSLDQCFLSTSIGQFDPAQVTVYVGPLPVPTMAVTASLAGGGSQFGMGGSTVEQGWFVYGLWTGGTPGAIAYLRVTGSKTALTN